MVELTPWEAKRARNKSTIPDPPKLNEGRQRRSRSALIPVFVLPRGNWSHLCGAAGSLITFILLFRPWLRARGWDGGAQVNGFGHIDATTQYLNTWSQSSPKLAHISGAWAILIMASAVVCITAVIANFRNPGVAVSTLATASAVAVAVFVAGQLLYFNSKEAELKAMVGFSGDWGSQIALAVRGLLHPGSYPVPGTSSPYATAELTSWALLTSGISLSTAVVTVLHWIRNRDAGTLRSPQ
jgi:hypothetical protein